MQTLPEHDVVLMGIGHTNAHVLRMWRREPLPGARLTCVTDHPIATYSGMLPGVLAGLYARDEMEIDIVRLCAAAGARLIVGEVRGLDLDRRRLLFADRPPVPFDVLSIGIGSVPSLAGVDVGDASRLVGVKPMQTFLERIERLWHGVGAAAGPIDLAIVGGGAGGVEVAFTLPHHLRTRLGAERVTCTLVTSDTRLLRGSLPRTARRARHVLERRGISMVTGRRVVAVHGRELRLDDGSRREADVIVWTTEAAAPPVLARLGLPTDARGFLLTADTLQTTSGAPVFAVGDTGTIATSPAPKAGVYAVRQGPVLWQNLRHALAGTPLVRYAPQRGFLKLLNTGDGRALGEWRGVSFEGAWVWRLKDAIDRRFVRAYQDVAPMAAPEKVAAPPPEPMRCAGCGGKVGASVLARALARLEIPPHDHVLVGLAEPDDAAIVVAPGNRPIAVTVDFFEAPLDDPYLVGRLATLNAASDAFAMGASPWAALAMITLPAGSARAQEETLYQVLAGSLEELRQMGATLVGGHTIEGPRLTVGFTMLASSPAGGARTKRGLRPGDALVLTKPLGTGVLLAAHREARCRARCYTPLLSTMLASNHAAAATAEAFGVSGLTDVTGFGLAGHLLEMLRAGDVAARVDPDAVPSLPGAHALLDEGVESTLAPANRHAEADIDATGSRRDAAYRVLFDPQTGGGLLIGVAAARAEDLVAGLRAGGCPRAAIIGEVVPAVAGGRRLRVGPR